MKFKRTVLLATFVVTMGLLLGAGATQAATVICENEQLCTENTSVIRIEDLEVTDSTGETTVYTVLFEYMPAALAYGDSLVYDFTNQEDASLAMEAVQEAINSNVPIPPTAGMDGRNKFFIGAKTVDSGQSALLVLALGSESFEEGWDECIDGCLNGVAPLEVNTNKVYAVFYDGIPKLLSPGGEIDDRTPDFNWRSVENATWYYLWVSSDSGDGVEEIIISDWYSAEEASCVFGGGLQYPARCGVQGIELPSLKDGSYNWWVLSWIPPTNGETNWEWSDPLSFTVAGPVPKTLTVELEGDGTGTVTSKPPGIDCGDTCEADFLGVAILTANPERGFETTWEGCDNVNPITNDCTVLMTEAKTVTATFSEPAPRTLTVELEGDGTGTVTSDPPGIDCGDDFFFDFECSAPFVNNTSVTLTATPDDGSQVKGWTGCRNVDLISEKCIVLMTESKTVRAIFNARF